MNRPIKTRCNGQWSEARFISFIKSTLRRASMRWAPKNDVKKEARVARGVYLCNGCKQKVPATLPSPPGKKKRVDNVFVDHIIPIVDPEVGFTTWDDFINNLFCEKHNLQVLCLKCHSQKTLEEKERTKIRKSK